METMSIDGLTLYYEAEEREAAILIGDACQQSVKLIGELWGQEGPEECRVYVMTSWQRFLFHSAPWPWRIWLGVTLPLRYARVQKLWDLSGGWAQRYGERQVIGVKPPRLMQTVDAGLRARLFVERETEEWVRHNTCHELVHAYTAHLGLPAWLHEGLAMVTVDRLAGRSTVKAETLDVLRRQSQGGRPQEGYRGAAIDEESLLYLAVRGYWITRYLADTRPQTLRGLLEQQPHDALESRLADEMGMSPDQFWQAIDDIVVSHFGKDQGAPAQT
jgi:hypothetical protein